MFATFVWLRIAMPPMAGNQIHHYLSSWPEETLSQKVKVPAAGRYPLMMRNYAGIGYGSIDWELTFTPGE